MVTEMSENFFREGLKFLKEDNLDRALRAFEKAYREDRENPFYMSYYGLCKALRGGEIGLGIELCTAAIKKEFYKAEFYLNLGKVYLHSGNKKGALKVFKKGITYDPQNEELNSYFTELGVRKPSVVPFLKRSNPVNKYLGIFFRRLVPNLLGKRRSQGFK